MVFYGIFLNQLSLTSILIPILCTLHKFFDFPYFYQRCGRRRASISTNPFIPYVGHIKTHIISKNWLENFGEFFLICVFVLFLGKIPVFLITGTRYRFESWKFGCAVKSYIQVMKITLIVLKEDFGFFSGPLPIYGLYILLKPSFLL